MRIATYRVQLHAGFTFADAGAIAPYLADLGISHLYCSPYLQAAPGSTHGYDVTDHSRLSAELGGAAGHAAMTGQLAGAGLGQVLDIVPNHMGLPGNAWWWDVLENGPSSRYASYFDIDWDPPQRKLTATVLMPVLADHYGRVLEAGEISIERRGGAFVVRYYEHEAPLSPRTLDAMLARAAVRAGSPELAGLASAHGELPHAILTDPAAVAERHAGKEALRDRLERLVRDNPGVAAAVDAEIAAMNADPDALDELLSRQNYRLAYWATAAEELSYRRFFNIETLAGLRMEDPEVFAATHRLILGLVRDGTVDGLRIDHVDGLADPQGYLSRLREASGGAYVVVEKILAPDEDLPGAWPTAGTSGYDFLNRVTQLYTDPGGADAMRGCFSRFTGRDEPYEDVAHDAKLQILRSELAAELERLTGLLADLCERHRRQRDHTRRELRAALAELIAAFGVYRGYAYPGRPVSDADRRAAGAAVAGALARRPDLDRELIEFLGDLLVLAYPGAPEAEFAIRFAQLSAPVMAKGVEDTAFYRYYPLASLNEVGGRPDLFGRPVAAFHAGMSAAARRWPEGMLTLSTHDTKRSADVRARLGLLAELPQAFQEAAGRWARRNARHKRAGQPDPAAEYLLYQNLVGAWPIDAGRASVFMAKAAREAKLETSWTEPDQAYEAALAAFVTASLADEEFRHDLEDFLGRHRLVERGRVTSLAQTALLLTCPGVPDLYQGTEAWDLSLVDPDNRRPVDYDARRALLAKLGDQGPEAALNLAEAGGVKLWLIRRLLAHRRAWPQAFGPGSGYEPLAVTGPRADHLAGFVRTPPDGTAGRIAVLVPRLVARLGEAQGGTDWTGKGWDRAGWAGTLADLPEGTWTSVLTGERHPGGLASAGGLLCRFPVAVLSQPDPGREG